MEDSKPTPDEPQVKDQLEQITAKVIQRVVQGLSGAIAGALAESGLADRVKALSDRVEGLAEGAESAPSGDPGDEKPVPGAKAEQKHICSEPDCDLPARARGLCSKHYQRLRYAEKRAAEAGDPLPKSLAEARSQRGRKPARKTEKRGGTICSQPDCERPTYAKGMCGKHFMEWVRAQKDLKAQRDLDAGDDSD